MMTHPIILLFVLQFTITAVCTIGINYIDSAVYVPTNSANSLSRSGTYNGCLCFAFFSSAPPIYQAFNFYKNNNTCLLFTSFLSKTYILINTLMNFTFLQVSSVTLPTSNVFTTAPSTVGITAPSYFNDSRQGAATGTYWDCCKLSCAWPDKAIVTSPPKTCAQDGSTVVSPYTASACNNGGAYLCANQQPWNVSSSLSYGYAGAYIPNQNESYWCCACYSLVFTSAPIAGKEMIVQAVNTAGGPSSVFVLQIPGSGWGYSYNKCSNQYGGTYSWGNQFGGITNRSDCANLPGAIQPGCYWRFDWLMNTVDPPVQFKEVSCPAALVNISGCSRI